MSSAAPNGRTVIYVTGCTPLSLRYGVHTYVLSMIYVLLAWNINVVSFKGTLCKISIIMGRCMGPPGVGKS